MPLNKLDNFIKNTEGRILYVSPSDLDSTDSIDNQGNSLARPFKTIQRALLEAARFSYVVGKNNDIVEKTTILLMPGEHEIDNRPGYTIYNSSGAKVSSPEAPGTPLDASTNLSLSLSSNFDLTQRDNVLYRFNSVNGGVVVPRGTSIVGLDLRKTKIRPKYIPNPTDSSSESAIFKITGACYFWQFSIFDADEFGTVYTSPSNFSEIASPTFSHHKLTCFEYADGINEVGSTGLTDLDMYYAKLTYAYGTGSRGRDILEKYPDSSGIEGFSKQRPEFEIVGAFASDPLTITSIEAGSGGVVTNRVTVTTRTPHNLSVGTPIKISGVSPFNYNVSTKVSEIDATDTNKFYFNLLNAPTTLITPGLRDDNSKVTIETDSVSGASPYIFNISLRSIWGMNGMHADGSKATGFRSMVVAQFTGVSLQKDDRAFVKYNSSAQNYSDNISITPVSGSTLSAESSSSGTVYHQDPNAIYRNGWETTHIKITNDAIIQIVSVFAIGYNRHFYADTGGDASITNSNSNFGQLSLVAQGFKKEAFDKDDKAFITNIIGPRSIPTTEDDIDWLSIDVGLTTSTTHNPTGDRLYLYGFNSEDIAPEIITQGYRVGARLNDKLYLNISGITSTADILMSDGVTSSVKNYQVTSGPTSNVFTLGTHTIQTGEKILVMSDSGKMPENIAPHKIYYAIRQSSTQIKIASSLSFAISGDELSTSGGANLRILSRVSDKTSGDIEHPVQWSSTANCWYIKTNTNNNIYAQLISQGGSSILGSNTEPTYFKRISDIRSLDEKIYKVRVVVPKQLTNAKTPESGFVIQESSSTGLNNSSDFSLSGITTSQYDWNRNPRFISTCSFSAGIASVTAEIPHNLSVGDSIIVRNVKDSSINTGIATFNKGYNGTFAVASIIDDMRFTYAISNQTPGSFTNNTGIRTDTLPRFERSDLQSNLYVYRNEVISEYIEGKQDGIYHLYVLNSDNSLEHEFTNSKYSQNVTDLYPQLDRDNIDDNPLPTRTFAKTSPLGEVVTNDLKKSITKESIDKLVKKFGVGLSITGVSDSGTSATITFDRPHGLAGIVTATISNGGSGFSTGTYYNVKLLNDGTSTWDGATAKVIVGSSGTVSGLSIINGGSGYTNGEILDLDGFAGAEATITTAGISSNIGHVVQFTGVSTSLDTYHRITSIPAKNQIAVAKTSGDISVTSNYYAFIVGSSVTFTAETTTGLTTFRCSDPHGLVAGNRFRIIDSNNNYQGDFIVNARVGVTTFTVKSGISTTSGYVLKHGFSANDAQSNISDENLAIRGITIFDDHILQINETGGINNEVTQFKVSSPTAGIATEARFPLGSYIQVDGEIMRIASSSLQGANKDQLLVIRGALSTRRSSHDNGSIIRKIKPLPVEFRRPSIIRASGHTFEYLGYGPGNYSTGLPQVQVKTLSEQEEFLVQSQERSGGIVVYTGMNNKGDFFIGNQKKSSATGEEITFDTPIPTITGEDTSRLSSVFDELTIKERIVVEGGSSNQILSQFDGPVTFNKKVTFNEVPSVGAVFKVVSTENSTKTTDGAIVVAGGVGIGKDVYIGGTLNCDEVQFGNIKLARTTDNTIDTSSGNLSLGSTAGSRVAITTNTTIAGILSVTDDITAFWTSDERLKDNIAPIDDPLSKVLSISGNTFDWNEKSNKSGHDVGLIAQEIEKVLPEAVTTRDNGYLAVDYHKVVPLLVEAIKELSAKVENLEQKLSDK